MYLCTILKYKLEFIVIKVSVCNCDMVHLWSILGYFYILYFTRYLVHLS